MTRLFNLDAQLLFDTALLALSVYVLFAALSYFLFKPARAVLADRRKRIESEMASAKAQRQEAERLGQEYQKKLTGAETECAHVLKDAREQAGKMRERILVEARSEARELQERARQNLERELEASKEGQRRQVIDLASRLAGNWILTSANENALDALTDEMISEMSEQSWQS